MNSTFRRGSLNIIEETNVLQVRHPVHGRYQLYKHTSITAVVFLETSTRENKSETRSYNVGHTSVVDNAPMYRIAG